MTIKLGQKNEPYDSPVANSASKSTVNYPRLTITHDKPMDLPGKDFEAKVTLHNCSTEIREDEKGNQRCTYSFDVRDITPGKCCKDMEDGEDEESEPEDAAMAIMKSMNMARGKKMMAGEEG